MRPRDRAKRTAAVGVILLSLIGAACGEETSGGSFGDPASSYSGTWVLSSGRGPDGNIELVPGYRITLDIRGERIGGTAACNSYGGDADIDGDSFSLGEGVSVTEMGCEPRVMQSEAAYLSALTEVTTIARQGETLHLTGPQSELSYSLLPPIPVAELTDTQWQLESLIQGTGPDGVASSAAPADLVLRSDGTLRGSTGCRDLEGEWTESGDEIVFTEFAVEGNCTQQLESQDGHVVDVLGDGFTAQIEGQTLTLFHGALGLTYRAEAEG